MLGKHMKKLEHILPTCLPDAPSCRQTQLARWHATTSECWYAIVPSEKTDTKAGNELRMLECAIVPSEKTNTLVCNEFRLCASLHVSRSSRWQGCEKKSHARGHCHLCHAAPGCWQLLLRHGEQEMRSEKTHSSDSRDGEATGLLRTWDSKPWLPQVPYKAYRPLFCWCIVSSEQASSLSATSTDYMLHWRKWPIACSTISDLMFLCSHLQAWRPQKQQNGINKRCTTRTWPRECRWTWNCHDKINIFWKTTHHLNPTIILHENGHGQN